MEIYKAINRLIFSINRIIFVIALLAYMVGTLGSLEGIGGASEWMVNIAFVTLGIGALSAFVEYLLTNASKEAIKLFYLQVIGMVTLILYMVLVGLLESIL
ncbi:MAG: hypothetical protein ACOC14_03835 [Bacillota bacterium]